MVAAPQDALEAAATVAREAGWRPLILGNALEGEARDVALVHAGIARQALRYGQPAPPPCVLLSGGETTVTIRGRARRSQRRVPARAGGSAARRGPRLGHRLRHRRHRRRRRQCRRDSPPGYAERAPKQPA